MSARGFDLVVVGEALVELSAPFPLTRAETFRLSFSGDALNASAAAAAAGASVALLTLVGDDELGDRLIAFLRRCGVRDSLIRRAARPNGAYLVGADPVGSREFVYLRTGSAASTLSPDEVTAAGLEDSRAVLLTGITQALSPSCAQAVEHAAATVHAAGGLVLYDPNYRRRLTAPEPARRALAAVARYADLVMPSCPGDTLPLLGTDDPAAAARECRRMGAAAAAVTCGQDGVLLDCGGGPLRIPAVPPEELVDATGAGDAFAGAVAARLALGDDLEDAVRLGTAAASLSLAGVGGTGRPFSLPEMRAHLAGELVAGLAPGTDDGAGPPAATPLHGPVG
jgi:2-dehydro-3-deoxygluconokinase